MVFTVLLVIFNPWKASFLSLELESEAHYGNLARTDDPQILIAAFNAVGASTVIHVGSDFQPLKLASSWLQVTSVTSKSNVKLCINSA